MNPNKLARSTGFLYLLLAVFGSFGLIYIPNNILVPGDAAATANNIMASEGVFRLSVVSALLTQVINIAVVLCLYKLLKPVSNTQAGLMVLFLLLGVPIAMLNELNHFAALLLLNNAEH